MDELLRGRTAVVTGASRGFGRATAVALAGAGACVVGVARDGAALAEVAREVGERFVPVVGDATDADLARRLLAEHRPTVVVLNAGATPEMRPLQDHDWESFSRPWEVDVRHVFEWLRAALLAPLAPGSTVVTVSSGAALGGSPLSGGYAGAKAAARFASAYAAGESEREGLGVRFTCVLPMLTPLTGLGAAAVASYAERDGVTPDAFVAGRGPVLTPEAVGASLVELVTGTDAAPAHLVTPGGLVPVP